jgi:hypothetical protein
MSWEVISVVVILVGVLIFAFYWKATGGYNRH